MIDRAVFVVFHQGIAPSLTGTDKYPDLVRYFGVNENHKKKYLLTGDGKFELLGKRSDINLEYDLPHYDASIQERGFMETSAYCHIYRNKLHLPYKFVGIAQYDMIWNDNVIRRIKGVKKGGEVLAKTKGIILSKGRWHRLMFAGRYPLDFVIGSYNKFFKSRHTKKDLEGRLLTLWQTYFMHHLVFEELSSWLSVLVKEVYPWANRPPYETYWGFLSGLSERAESIFFALRKNLNISEIGLDHSEAIVSALKTKKEHYGCRPSPANMNWVETLSERFKYRLAHKEDFKKLNIAI